MIYNAYYIMQYSIKYSVAYVNYLDSCEQTEL